MSKIIRKARSQMHSVREDGLRRQIHAARSDRKNSRRTASSTHNKSTPGFKFSDIDNDDMDDFDWMDTGSYSKTDSQAYSKTDSQAYSNKVINEPQTSDYYSSYSPEGSYSSQDHAHSRPISDQDVITTVSDDTLFDSNYSSTTKHVERPKESSLFDDLPDLNDDNIIQGDAHQHDPLGLNPYSMSPNNNTLFDHDPITIEDIEDPLFTTIEDDNPLHSENSSPLSDRMTSKVSSVNENRLTDLVNSLFADEESNNDRLEQCVNDLQKDQLNDNDHRERYTHTVTHTHTHTHM